MCWIMTFPKFICWNAKSQYLSMKHCFEIGLREVIKLSEVIAAAAAAAAKSLQSCPTLCDPIDGSPSGSPVPGILQARTLEWVAISFSNAGKWQVKVKSLSPVWLLATPWTAAYQAPPSMGFSRQEYWSGVPLPSLSEVIKVALTQYDWCPYKWGKFVHRDTCRGRTMWRDIVGKWPWQAKREPGTDSSHMALRRTQF